FEKRQVEYVLFHVNDPQDHGGGPMVRRLFGNPRGGTPAPLRGGGAGVSGRGPHAEEPPPLPPPPASDFIPPPFNGEDKAPPPEPREAPAPQWYDVLVPHGQVDLSERDYAWQQRERFEAMMPVHGQRYLSDLFTFHGVVMCYSVGLIGGQVGYARLGSLVELP